MSAVNEAEFRITLIRTLSVYAPVGLAFVLVWLRPRGKRLLAAVLVAMAWVVPSLLAVQIMNLYFGWWGFRVEHGLLRGMPIDLWFGWTVLWGAIPILAFRRLRLAWVVAIFLGVDLVLMPACFPAVDLYPSWLMGEAVALAVVLIPSQCFARWTYEDSHLKARAALHVLTAAGVFLFLIPEIASLRALGQEWAPLMQQSPWLRGLELQALALLGVPGVSAVQEFAARGAGTPIPYDPPKRLVVSGVYRYIANPMQLSCSVVMTVWGAVLLHNLLAGLGGLAAFIYSVGLARWDEAEDMRERFGADWERYRRNVRPWRIRWRPWSDPERQLARLYIAESCGQCSEVRRWFESRGVRGLKIVAAEDHPTGDLTRMTYDPMDGCSAEEGVRAFARGLEHVHAGWAYAGAILRLPGVAHLAQLLGDVCGMGPQRIARRRVECEPSLRVGELSRR